MTSGPTAAYLGIPIEQWIRAARDSDPLVRRLAVYALGMIGPTGGKRSIKALEAAMKDDQPFVRLWAASALARVRPGDERVAPELVAAMRHEAAFMRSLGAWQLGRLGPDLPGAGGTQPVESPA